MIQNRYSATTTLSSHLLRLVDGKHCCVKAYASVPVNAMINITIEINLFPAPERKGAKGNRGKKNHFPNPEVILFPAAAQSEAWCYLCCVGRKVSAGFFKTELFLKAARLPECSGVV